VELPDAGAHGGPYQILGVREGAPVDSDSLIECQSCWKSSRLFVDDPEFTGNLPSHPSSIGRLGQIGSFLSTQFTHFGQNKSKRYKHKYTDGLFCAWILDASGNPHKLFLGEPQPFPIHGTPYAGVNRTIPCSWSLEWEGLPIDEKPDQKKNFAVG
jgi:hypothetical protein